MTGAPDSARREASRLKRMRSASMRRNRGLARLEGCANTVARLVPDHSRAPSPMRTEKDMSESAASTPRWAKSFTRFG